MYARRLVAALTLTIVSLVGTSAFAQSDRQRAADLAEEAGAAFEAGDIETAIALYEEAFGLVPDPSFAYNLGGLCDATGDLPCAALYFTQYIELFPGAQDRAEIEAYLEDLQADLEASYTRLSISSEPAGAEVWLMVDGGGERLLGETPLDAWVAPGTFEVEVRADGFEPLRDRRNGLAGLVVPMELELTPVVVADPVEDPVEDPIEDPVPVEPPPERNGNGLGIALTSAGGAAIVGGAVVFVVRGGTVSDYNDAVAAIGTDAVTDPVAHANQIADLESDAETLAGVGYATIGVGAALTGVGLVMLMRNGGNESNTSVSAGPMRDGFGVSFSTRF